MLRQTSDEVATVGGKFQRQLQGLFPPAQLPADSPLWDLPNVLVAPHTAANSEKEDARIADLFIDNVRAFIDGRRLRNVVNTELFY